MPTEELLSVEDAADKLGVTKQTVTRLIREEKMPAQKVGNQWVLYAKALQAYLDENNLVPEPKDHGRVSDDIPDIVALSFFSGALGLDLGMEEAGISPVLYCENDRKCRMTIQACRPDVALIGDINEYTAADILKQAGLPEGAHVDVMFGGPPCQAFSTAGARRAFDDARGNVFLKYLELAAEIRPTYLVIENVRGLLSTPYPLEEGGPSVKGGALRLILKHLEEAGYTVAFNLYNAANFGAPQIRERVVLIAKRGSEKVPYLTPTHSGNPEDGLLPWRTFREAVEGLDPEDAHHSDFPAKRLKYFEMLSEGQYWKYLPEPMQREAMGKAYDLGGGKTGFYRRIWFDRPCPTLVTSPTMPATDLCHPTENRPLSVEEYKRVQEFPDDWRICGDVMDQYKQIGNAVPVALGRAIGRALLDDMNGTAPDPRFESFRHSRYRRTSDETWQQGTL
ncbi:MAG: DNA cytosine methyltransferase [Adlercreutzia sp.]|uniref:DNA cytosine methyltransferase n=1 Tax=uncultured Adlercreutzia sp. TaxID=875803 RepID=UPI0021749A5A|nr:DNA cytosine methyltransferase [uncultured Adlercreutzia sp.]MCI8425481.1 DNA cytosine methyltransferase [Adlercreutzia sp.]